MKIMAATKKEVLMSLDIGAPSNKIATLIARYDFGEGSLRYDIYPILGLSSPKIFLTEPILKYKEKMSLARAVIVLYDLECTIESSVTPDIGYRIHVNNSTYVWNIDANNTAQFVEVPDDSDNVKSLFKVFLDKATDTVIKAVSFTGSCKKEKEIPYRIVL